ELRAVLGLLGEAALELLLALESGHALGLIGARLRRADLIAGAQRALAELGVGLLQRLDRTHARADRGPRVTAARSHLGHPLCVLGRARERRRTEQRAEQRDRDSTTETTPHRDLAPQPLHGRDLLNRSRASQTQETERERIRNANETAKPDYPAREHGRESNM